MRKPGFFKRQEDITSVFQVTKSISNFNGCEGSSQLLIITITEWIKTGGITNDKNSLDEDKNVSAHISENENTSGSNLHENKKDEQGIVFVCSSSSSQNNVALSCDGAQMWSTLFPFIYLPHIPHITTEEKNMNTKGEADSLINRFGNYRFVNLLGGKY